LRWEILRTSEEAGERVADPAKDDAGEPVLMAGEEGHGGEATHRVTHEVALLEP